VLTLTVNWPTPLRDVKLLHHLWLVVQEGKIISQDHSKIGGFEKALRAKRSTAGAEVCSVARIPLPFKVETEVDHEPLFWSGSGTYVLYANLKSALDGYSGHTPSKAFRDMTVIPRPQIERASNSSQLGSVVTARPGTEL